MYMHAHCTTWHCMIAYSANIIRHKREAPPPLSTQDHKSVPDFCTACAWNVFMSAYSTNHSPRLYQIRKARSPSLWLIRIYWQRWLASRRHTATTSEHRRHRPRSPGSCSQCRPSPEGVCVCVCVCVCVWRRGTNNGYTCNTNFESITCNLLRNRYQVKHWYANYD